MDKYVERKLTNKTIFTQLVDLPMNQKIAIINLFLRVATCDAVTNEKELDLLRTYLAVLGVSQLHQALAHLNEVPLPQAISKLKQLSNAQKELLGLIVNQLNRIYGQPNANEVAVATSFFELIGLPTESYIPLR